MEQFLTGSPGKNNGGFLKRQRGRTPVYLSGNASGRKKRVWMKSVKLRYQMAGMVHILAISGLHISVLGMGLFSLLKKTFTGERAGWLSFTERDPAVRDADRQQCVCHARSLYVCACDRDTYSGEKL